MSPRARMRYVIRSPAGEELVCPSLADLHALYAQGFVGDDDLVRAETSERWVRAGAMPALRGVRERRRDWRKVLMLLGAAAALLLAFVLLCSCGSDAAVASARRYDPDVPTWRGGCFLSGPADKVVNATASADVISFGQPCSDPGRAGGLVYLDRYDPASGDGDVTVLSSAQGAAPVVVAPHGGGGSVDPGSTGARIDAGEARLLTLANVSFVTGDLVEAPLPGALPTRSIAPRVRVGNYDFVAGGGLVYVGNYDPDRREGDLFHALDGAPQLLAPGISRFDFLMYRLSPDLGRVAYLAGWSEQAGGQLFVQSLPPSGAPAVAVAPGVYRMAWADDGQLVFRTVNGDGITYALWAWNGADPARQVAPAVTSALVVGRDLLYTTGWSVLEQRVAIHRTPAAGGPDLIVAPSAALSFTAASPAQTGGVVAYLAVGDVTVPTQGELHVARLAGAGDHPVDAGVTIDAGVGTSPRAGFVSYALGFAAPQAPGSANPQPGIARELKVASVDSGAAFVLARNASTFVAWDAAERFAAALDGYDPAANRGELVVRRLGDGAALLSLPRVGNARFGFADDGTLLWAIQEWDDALRRGALVVATLSADAVSAPATISTGVSWVAQARAGRVLYGVEGAARDGLWLGGGP